MWEAMAVCACLVSCSSSSCLGAVPAAKPMCKPRPSKRTSQVLVYKGRKGNAGCCSCAAAPRLDGLLSMRWPAKLYPS